MMKIESRLREIFDLPSKQIQEISRYFVEERFEKGQIFLDQGQRAERLSFIASGIFRVFAQTEAREVTQWIGGEGYFITDLSSFLFDQSSRWQIQALTDARVFSLRKSDYRRFEVLVPHWNILEKRFIAKCFMVLENRVFDFISLSAEDRYMQYFEQHKEFFNQVPLQYIASVLGMTPETLSRIRAKLAVGNS
ncbi:MULTISPECIES: Crp/Fnr family transcriptional regulator [Sphingobacterium]|uniref:Crp/Fnr family transcriptional regulator n=1 Tax=Sphingobacterium TaxID=28453 RepID=UPI0013DC0DF3|nr:MULTISPECIES: Crp/Fnr family transcriptional regulator [unclassified Sphingobacterium]